MKRHELSVRRRTTIAQRLPRDCEGKTDFFPEVRIKLRKTEETQIHR